MSDSLYAAGGARIVATTPSQTWTETVAWAVGGEIKAPSGTDNHLEGMDAAVVGNTETLTLKKLRGRIRSGTSVTLKLQKNGVDVSGYTGLVFTTATTDFGTGDVDIVDGDVLELVASSPVGTPKGLRCTAVFERSVG